MVEIACCYLDGNADAVEFCPHNPFHRILAAATYTLQEEGVEPHRAGTLSLFSTSFSNSISNSNSDSGPETGLLELVHHQNTTSGIFDIKWNPIPHNDNHNNSRLPLLALADADGCVSLHSLQSVQSNTQGDEQGIHLREVCTEKISSSMCLCVDWRQSSDCISVGHSDGSISILSFKESQLEVIQSWSAHQYEVWSTYFDLSSPYLLYSGSDDCRFSCYDTRQDPSDPVFHNSKTHKMGVCSISQNPSNTNILLTGSYDEHLRVWDVRSALRPVNEKSVSLGGGVWRIKYHPYNPSIVLAACMHNGFCIIKIGENEMDVLERYGKHESLAYGADWKKGESDRPVVASCSFYDRLLRVWQPDCLI